MIRSLTSTQLKILRRCTGGLRVWEVGVELKMLLAELLALRQLDLVAFDETHGYGLTPQGEACLLKFDIPAARDRNSSAS